MLMNNEYIIVVLEYFLVTHIIDSYTDTFWQNEWVSEWVGFNILPSTV